MSQLREPDYLIPIIIDNPPNFQIKLEWEQIFNVTDSEPPFYLATDDQGYDINMIEYTDSNYQQLVRDITSVGNFLPVDPINKPDTVWQSPPINPGFYEFDVVAKKGKAKCELHGNGKIQIAILGT